MRNGSPETEGEHDRGFFRVETRDAIKTLSNFLRGSYKEERRIRELAKIFNPSHITVDDLADQQVARVTQMMLEATLRILANDCQTSDCHHDPSLVSDKWTLDYMAEFGHFMLKNLEILLRDGSGVHVMVTVIEVLGGVRVGRHWSRKTMGFAMRSSIGKELEKDNIIDQIPDSFSRILRRVTQNLIITRSDRYLRDVILGRGTSLIQNLLFILRVRSPEVCQTAAKRLVEVIFANPDNRKAITTNSVSAYLVEAIMLVADHNRLMYIWKNHLRGHLSEMWRDDIANFVVQRLIDAAQEIELFGEICDEMLPKLGTIFACNRPGIGVCLAKAAERFPEMQELFISALMRAFNCFEPKERQIALVSLMLFGDESPLFHRRRKDPQIIWLHGSLMLQYIFRYKQPELVSNSLLSLSARRLVNICNDKSGSHIIDCFLLSSTVTERDKNIFKEKLRGHYAYVASDRFGTRVIESLLAHSDITIRNTILDELANHDFQTSPDTQNNTRNSPNISVKRRHSSPSNGEKREKRSKN